MLFSFFLKTLMTSEKGFYRSNVELKNWWKNNSGVRVGWRRSQMQVFLNEMCLFTMKRNYETLRGFPIPVLWFYSLMCGEVLSSSVPMYNSALLPPHVSAIHLETRDATVSTVTSTSRQKHFNYSSSSARGEWLSSGVSGSKAGDSTGLVWQQNSNAYTNYQSCETSMHGSVF